MVAKPFLDQTTDEPSVTNADARQHFAEAVFITCSHERLFATY